MSAAGLYADTLRIATYNTELQRDGPGLLLRDILRGEDPDIVAVMSVLAETAPDIVVLQGFDYDLTGAALNAFADRLAGTGPSYPWRFAARPNTGYQSGIDLDGDGRAGDPRDAQGYGRFSGQGGMAVLSRFEIIASDVQTFTDLLWRDFPGALLPETDARPFPSPEAQAIQRLSTTAHWVVPVQVPGLGRLSLLTFHASPPVFDGPEDRNGRRNHDEILFWQYYLDGTFGPAPAEKLVLLGDTNQDPQDGEGRKAAIRGLLNNPLLQDPAPRSTGSVIISDDPFDTADWDDPVPGNLRVDYVLPSRDLTVTGSGVWWPDPASEAGETAATASRHRLVWVDIAR
nr:endonuclease/exonuclease/phosphatase family protein [Roseobacter ponti]